MQHNLLRVLSVVVILALAIVIPILASGYSELRAASISDSYTQIAEHYWTAAQRLPWRADAYELAGHAYYHAKDYAKADVAYQKAFHRNALSADGWVAWGDVQYLQDDPLRATQIWEQGVVQQNSSDSLYSRLAQTYQENHEYARAADYLQRYVASHQEDASAHYRLGLLLTLTDPNGALTELINASQLDPQFDPAVETLRSALNLASLNDSASARFVLIGRGLGLVHEWELAQSAFASAIEADEENAEAWAWLGESNQQSAGNGTVELDRAYALNPNSPTVRGLRGLQFQRAGNFRAALTEFQAASALDKTNPAWQVSMGETYSKLGDLIRAMQAYQAATALVPENADYWRMLAIFCAQNNVNIRDVGVPAAQQAVVLDSENSASVELLGWLLLLDARYDEAELMLLQAIELDPNNALAHLHVGMLYLEKHDRALAQSHFVTARDLGNADAQMILNQYFP
jgi:tetratricopeptide (TPR) repeat protein